MFRIRCARVIAFVLVAMTGLVALPAKGNEKLVTGRVLSIAEVRALTHVQTFLGDDAYAVLNAAGLHEIQHMFERELNEDGVAIRHDRAELTSAFVATAQMAFVVRNWQSRSKAKALAVGEAWLSTPGHGTTSVVVAITDQGVVFWDPVKACQMKGAALASSYVTMFRI